MDFDTCREKDSTDLVLTVCAVLIVLLDYRPRGATSLLVYKCESSPVVLYAPIKGLSTRAKETIYRWGLLLLFLLFEDVWLSMHLVCMMAWVTNPVTFQPSLLGTVVVHAASDPPCVGPGGT